MSWHYWAMMAAVLASPVVASAADKPEIGAPAAWIKPLTAASLAASPDSSAIHVLLNDVQVSFHGDTTQTFSSSAIEVAKPEGLSALGTFSLA